MDKKLYKDCKGHYDAEMGITTRCYSSSTCLKVGTCKIGKITAWIDEDMEEMRKRVANVSVEDYINELEKEESSAQVNLANNHNAISNIRMTRDEWIKTQNTGYFDWC